MKKIPFAVALATVLVIFYLLAPFIGIPEHAVLFMFSISPFLIIFMVCIILKYSKLSTHTVDESFYDDWDYEGNQTE